jgi:hypothetical protein
VERAFRLRLRGLSLCRESRRCGNVLLGFVAGIEQGQCGFAQIALVGDLPFVVGFDEHGAGQAQQRRRVGKDPDDVGTALDPVVEALDYPALGGTSIHGAGLRFSG